MPRALQPGDRVNGYGIESRLSQGAFAYAYRAVRESDGLPVFLKQYVDPTPEPPPPPAPHWYPGYVRYQDELRRRVMAGPVARSCVQAIEFFEAEFLYARQKGGGHVKRRSPAYYQAFELIDTSHDLAHVIERIRGGAKAVSYEQRVTFAKVFVSALRQLHASGIIHTDLKPPNLLLIPDSSLEARYRLKLIDMDWSLLADRPAPFRHEGFRCTAGYASPEHMSGETPVPASDVFTAGIILYELLDSGSPYETDDDCAARVFMHAAAPPTLRESSMPTEWNAIVREALHACLNPDPASRPSTDALHQALLGRAPATPAPAKRPMPPSPPIPEPLASPATPAPDTPVAPTVRFAGGAIALRSVDGAELRIATTQQLGARAVSQLGADAQFWDALHQCALERRADSWVLKPNPVARNQTLLNGAMVAEPTRLRCGDVISVGNAVKGVIKLPLTVVC